MKRFIVLFAVLIFNICYGQNDSTKTVNLISYLPNGETLNYSVLKTTIDSNSTENNTTKEEAFNFKITVKDSTDSNYIISYYRTADIFANPQLDELPEDLREKMIKLSTIKFDYETDEWGTFKRIVNEDLLSGKISSDFQELLDMFKQENTDENVLKFMEDFIGAIDPNSLISLYSQDVHALHYALGASFNLRDTIPFEEEVIAPVFNIPVKMKGILYCDEYDEENNYLSVIEEKIIDGNFMEKMIEFFKKYENKEKPIDENLLNNFSMEMYMHNNYQYNSFYGVATYIELYREVIVENQTTSNKKIEIYEISLVED